MIPDDHPLQRLFIEMVGRHYAHEIGIRDHEVIGYVAHLLAEFCDAEQLFKIHNAAGTALTDVGEMLMESNPIFGPAPSFDHGTVRSRGRSSAAGEHRGWCAAQTAAERLIASLPCC